MEDKQFSFQALPTPEISGSASPEPAERSTSESLRQPDSEDESHLEEPEEVEQTTQDVEEATPELRQTNEEVELEYDETAEKFETPEEPEQCRSRQESEHAGD